ncbi:hypothetical protein BT69DRAFT_1228457 [Atractiella rhizophila]|nr:hypothetical protein BT69DRAFT_1228457 [Atractiella rhizophila]
MRLDQAIDVVPECMTMCPEFEVEEREYQGAGDLMWECYPGTQKMDRSKAVKAFHRPAAGNEAPLPIDIRPPAVLKSTLDYLFHVILAQDPEMDRSHNFVRDRTRAIRQDFTILRDAGLVAQECFERIARYHIVILHRRRGKEGFEEHIELEQLRKGLFSLMQFYDDARKLSLPISPNEPEFRAYHLIVHIRSSKEIRQTESLPKSVLDHPTLKDALVYHKLVQTTNETRGERGRQPANSEASVNGFSRFLRRIRREQTGFLMACLLEIHFDDVRRAGMKSLKRSYMENHKYLDLGYLVNILAFDDTEHAKAFFEFHGLNVVMVDGKEFVEVHRKVQWIGSSPLLFAPRMLTRVQ